MTRLHLQPCRNWVATSLTRPFTVRYIPFSQTLEVLDTYSSTNNLITVRTCGILNYFFFFQELKTQVDQLSAAFEQISAN